MTHFFVTIVVSEGNHEMDLFYHMERADDFVWTHNLHDEIIRQTGLEKSEHDGMTFLGELVLVTMHVKSITEEQLRVLKDLNIV